MWYEIVCRFPETHGKNVHDWLLENIGHYGEWYCDDHIVHVVTFYLKADTEQQISSALAFKVMFGESVIRDARIQQITRPFVTNVSNTCWI